MVAVRGDDETIFPAEERGDQSGLMFAYLPGAAWTWAVCENDNPPFITFNDV